jgi:hypothetical protein
MASTKKFDPYYFATLLFILVTANANMLSSNDIWWFGSFAVIFFIAIYKKTIQPNDLKYIGAFSAIYLILIAIRDPFINGLDMTFVISDAVFLVKFIYLCYVFCLLMRKYLVIYVVKVITHLTVISFFFYALQLASSDLIYKLFTAAHLPSPNQIPGYCNILVFTYVKDFHDYTNSGFAWEPAAFGAFLVIALMLNLFLNNFRFERKSWILIAGLVTTFATTDYLAGFILLFLVYRYRIPKLNGWAVLLIGLFAALFVLTPFLGSKISDTYYEDLADLTRLKFLATYYKRNNMEIPLNRFSSMIYIYDNFKYNLIWGVSNKYNDILNRAYSINISNGIFDFLAKYGLLALIYLIYKYAKLCAQFVIKGEYVFYCIVILMVIGFGEPLLGLPFILMFLFISPEQELADKARRRNRPGLPDADPALQGYN